MEIGKGPVRARSTAGTWTCKIWYKKNPGTTNYVYIHADSKEQCKERVEEQIAKIKLEYGQ